ncbi:PilZ domain-containing protein [Microvirga sp. GCM10011540]|uniref:PilZ domain-containing protein n=1 Tax=Microvirga sp. GCM10011540 TaxID=3317338 RepID=UPI003623FC55
MKPVGSRIPGVGRLNLRRTRRMRVLQQAKIVIGTEVMLHCEVRDLSAGGAKIAIKQHVALPEQFDLFICAHDIRVHRARMRWRQGDFVGVSFGADEADEQPLALPAPQSAPAQSYPVLVQSNSVGARVSEPRHLRPASGEAGFLIVEGDRVPSAELRPARTVIRTGPYGWERRRLRGRRSAV